jgi:hypothetical protein
MTRGLRFRIAEPIRVLLALGVVFLAGCDRGPKGPGAWEVTIEPVVSGGSGTSADRLPGIAFLAVSGEGIEGFQVPPGAFISARVVAGEPYHRVVVVVPDGDAPMTFQIQVRDRRAAAPTANPVEVFSRSNARLPVQDAWRIRIRP